MYSDTNYKTDKYGRKMPSIYISGIPKGLDRRTVSLRIRRDIETVAQVRNIWIQNDKGYGSVSLYDETSAEFVLKLNGKIVINGKALSLTKLRNPQRVCQTQRPTTLTRRQQVDDDQFVFSGYDSYSSYRKHQPTNDTLFQDINQIPTKKIIKRKPWKNDVILSHVASPKSRSKRNKRRQTKKKKGSRWNSQQLTPQTNDRRRRRNVVHHTLGSPEEVSTCRNEQVKCLGHPYSTSTYNKESEDIASLAQASFHNTPVPCTANVHVYDHSKRLLSIEVDNNNVFQSINTCLKYNHILPPDNMMVIMYNGKAISEDWQPQMENEDNIHVCVKGKGGMQNTATYREDTESTPGNKEEGARSRETTNRHHHRTLASTSDGYQKPMKDLPDSEYSTMDSIRSPFAQTPMHTVDYDKLATTLLNKMREPRIFDKGYNPVTSLLEEVSEGRKDVVHVSGALTEDQAGAFPKDENYKANVQVTDIPQFASTFSQDAEAFQARLMRDLELHDYFPGQLTFTDVMAIQQEEKEEADTLADIPMLILRKLIMLDFTSREYDLNDYFAKLDREKERIEVVSQSSSSDTSDDDYDNYDELFNDRGMQASLNVEKCNSDSISDSANDSSIVEKLNPIDVFLSVFICSDPTLKRRICLKMFSCCLAIPLIFPIQTDKHKSERLTFSMWPLRPIIVHNGETETSIVNCKQNIVSFIRLGRLPISKSKLANNLLHDTPHDTFFNYDCKLGSSDKKASLGLVEASWFLPSIKHESLFKTVTLMLNLRGDAFCNAEQVDYLKRVSHVMIVVIDVMTIKTTNKKWEYLKASHQNIVFLITGELPAKDFISKCTKQYMRSKPNGFNAKFIPLMKDGRNANMAEIKEELLTTIGKWLDGKKALKTMHDLCKHAQQMCLSVDEDAPTCKLGMKLANLIFHRVEKCSLGEIKTKFTPLQKQLWKEYTDSMKELYRPDLNFRTKDKLNQKMVEQSAKQWDVFRQQLDSWMKDVTCIIINIDGDVLVHFLDSLSLYLDEKTRLEINYYHNRFDDACNKLRLLRRESSVQTGHREVAHAQKERDKTEEELSEASFGTEHILREMGQIYESSLNSNDNSFRSHLPFAVANIIKQGYPFELMDGDVGNIPLQWVERVFEELKSIINNERVLTLSILGLQSSGKSTLFNAMFGLTFPVSAGRCTRGIYLQLLPVNSDNFNYVLVVDTEGLRAHELRDQRYQRDNQLATLVLGMSDITIINVMSENITEMYDILKISAFAFLKLKMASENLKLSQSCVFVHQNIADMNAKSSMLQARKTLNEMLDEITQDAAKTEKDCDVTSFNDVIKFDSDQQVFYFSPLWKGDPPMAPANPAYSRDVQRLKSFIFDKLARRKSSYLSISDTFVHIKDLWSAILTNDLVFSFTNSLELKVYGKLEEKYQEIIWDLEKHKKELEAKMFDDDKLYETLNSKYDKKVKKLRNNLQDYLKNIEKRHDISKWKDVKLHSWDMFALRLRKQILDMYSRGKDEYESLVAFATLTKGVYRKATDLASSMKGTQYGDVDKTFNDHWNKWIPKENQVHLVSLMESIVRETFREQRDIVIPEELNIQTNARSHVVEFCDSNDIEENSGDDMNLHKIVSPFSHIKRRLKSQRRRMANKFANETLRDIDSKLEGMSQINWKFNEKLMRECPMHIVQHIDEFNRQHRFTLLGSFKLKLVVRCFRETLPNFQRCYSEYRTKYCMEAKLQQYKHNVLQYFQDILTDVPDTVIVSKMFCNIIETHAEDKIRSELPYLIFQHTVVKFGNSKQMLMKCVLKDLAQKQNFNSYKDYIKDPYSYTFNWLKKYTDGECFDSGEYVKNVLLKLDKIFTDIFDVMNKYSPLSTLDEWISDFQKEIKETLCVQTESLVAVGFLPITNLNDFIEFTQDKLKQVREGLEKQFLKDTKTTIKWYGKSPYEMSMEKLWGCRATCPFCNEPCKWNSDHSGPHSCIQHRPQGIAGRKRTITSKLWVESCSDVVSTLTYTYKCFPHQDNKCDEGHWFTYSHFYRNYREFFPDWHIPPCSDVSGSTYWAWVLKTFNEDLTKHYGAKIADIPSTWTLITKQKAVESLQK